VLAAKFESEAHQVRRAMKLVETAWLANPHPDLADAYAHVKLGDSARQRLQRVETLAAKIPADKAGYVEGQLAIARAAIDASEFARARAVLAPYVNDPTQRVALLMAEIERTEHGDGGRARAWTLRAVRARHDPAWTADGYVSDRWRPVSPVTGRLDAFQWQTPVASLPSDRGAMIESSAFEEAMLAAPPPKRVTAAPSEGPAEPVVTAPDPVPAPQDNSPPLEDKEISKEIAGETVKETAKEEPVVTPAEPVQQAPEIVESSPAAATPVFRTRADLGKPTPAPIPAVIPIVRAPDDPGIDDEGPSDEFTEQIGTPRDHAKAQAGGWRGFWSRWGG
jgi:HemY protein